VCSSDLVLKGTQASLIEIPTVKTRCEISFRDGNNNRPQLLMVDQCDKILIKIGDNTQTLKIDATGFVFNNGDNAGMVILSKLTDNLNSLKTYCEGLKSAIESGFTGVGEGSAASGTAAKTAFDTAMTGKLISFENMENTKVKH
jgi:hypothetical protein